jgi:hypothetical protein
MKHTHSLTHFEQRGTLVYMQPNYSYKTVTGSFYLEGNTVVMRKVRGRNRFQLCNVQDVYEFENTNLIGGK